MKQVLILFAILFSILGCESLTSSGITSSDQTIVSSDTTIVQVVPPVIKKRIALYWEKTTEKHDERKPWSDALVLNIEKYFDTYNSAQDTARFCPKYKSLTKDQKIKAIGEFFVALAYYESGFNPKSESVDVGTKFNKDSWSVGLYQMSAQDGAAKALKVDYLGLKDAVKNINVATYQMNTQVKKTGLFILPNSSKYRYWAIILESNRYQNINGVINRVNKHAPFCK